MNLKLKKVLSVFMILSMIIAAGCQAVDGLNLNQVIKNMTKVKSAEGTYEFEFKLALNEEEIAEQVELEGEDAEELLSQLRNFSQIKLAVDHYKVQDETHASMKGTLTFGEHNAIGFDLRMTDKLMVIKLDGAKQPFSIDLTGERQRLLTNHYYETELGFSYEELYADEEYYIDEELYGDAEAEYAAYGEEMIAAIQQISELVTDYSIGHLPNIERLKVEHTTEMIRGEQVALFNLQGELKGMELWNWAKKLVNALANDREGLEKLFNEIFTIVSEHEDSFANLDLSMISQGFYTGNYEYTAAGPYAYVEEDYEELDFENEDIIDEFISMENEEAGTDSDESIEPEMTPEEIQAQVVEELINALQELKRSMNELEQEDGDTLKQVLNDSLSIKFNYGIDMSLDVRKQGFSIDYRVDPALKEEQELYGFDGFTITTNSQMWNVNGEVKALEPVTTLSTVSIESLPYLQGYEVIRLFEEDALISNVLRNQLHITEQTYWSFVDEESDYGLYLTNNKLAMIPAREIIEEFGGKVSYDKVKNSIVLYDDATNTTIEIQTGSRSVIVNGVEAQWAAPVQARNGVTFVPARDMANALGADISWSNSGYLEITREP